MAVDVGEGVDGAAPRVVAREVLEVPGGVAVALLGGGNSSRKGGC